MILIESINIEIDSTEMMTVNGKSQRTYLDQSMNIVLKVSSKDAALVANAINSDGTIYPDKIIEALYECAKRKGAFKKQKIKIDFTRGIDL